MKSLSDNLIAAGSMVTEQEQARQLASLEEVPLQANLASNQKPDNSERSKHTGAHTSYSQEYKHGYRGLGRGWSRGSGQNWSRTRPQCQLCGKISHLVQTR